MDKLQGNERETIYKQLQYPDSDCWGIARKSGGKPIGNVTNFQGCEYLEGGIQKTTKGTSEWEGWGTTLKPACEHWILCRKPLGEKTIAENVLKHRTGGINVDGCRIETVTNNDQNHRKSSNTNWGDTTNIYGTKFGCGRPIANLNSQGRFPANVILDDSEVVRAGFPNVKSGKVLSHHHDSRSNGNTIYNADHKWGFKENHTERGFGDSGSAVRFFYCAKASKSDRDEGLEGFEEKDVEGWNAKNGGYNVRTWIDRKDGKGKVPVNAKRNPRTNNHPTVKSTELMKYLCRLITPPGGTVLDPFMGSGSTGKAAILEGFDFIGIEQDAEYYRIAEARINFVLKKREKQLKLIE